MLLVAVPYSQAKKRSSHSHALVLGLYRWAVKNGPRRQVKTNSFRRKLSGVRFHALTLEPFDYSHLEHFFFYRIYLHCTFIFIYILDS